MNHLGTCNTPQSQDIIYYNTDAQNLGGDVDRPFNDDCGYSQRLFQDTTHFEIALSYLLFHILEIPISVPKILYNV